MKPNGILPQGINLSQEEWAVLGIRYLSHVMNVATPTKDCSELVSELLVPIIKARSEKSLTRQEENLLLDCETQIESLLANVFENYKSLDEDSPTGSADLFGPMQESAAPALAPAVQVYTLLHDILSLHAQTMFRNYLQTAAKRRCRKHMAETDEFVSSNSEGFLMDSITISTAYLMMKNLCINISNEIQADIKIHNQHILPRIPLDRQSPRVSQDMNKTYAAHFSPFWNEIIRSLREEDYISYRQMDLLSIPSNTGSLRLVQWPLFLLSSKIWLAIDVALDCKDSQADLWNRVCRDKCMAYAVQECYYTIEIFLHSPVDREERLWVERIYREINNSISVGSLVITLSLHKLPVVLSRFTALTGLLIRERTPEREKGAAKAVYELYDIVTRSSLIRGTFWQEQEKMGTFFYRMARGPKNSDLQRMLIGRLQNGLYQRMRLFLGLGSVASNHIKEMNSSCLKSQSNIVKPRRNERDDHRKKRERAVGRETV